MTDGERFILELETKRVAKLRYGRAMLRIARWGDLHTGELGQAISDFKQDQISAEELCWQLARERVESHSPSFIWEEAELDRLLPLVTEASTEPEFPSPHPEAVAQLLVETQAEEAERIRASHERLREQFANVAGIRGIQSNLFSEVAKISGLGQSASMIQDVARQVRGTYTMPAALTDAITSHSKIADLGFANLNLMSNLGTDWTKGLGFAHLGQSLTKQLGFANYTMPNWLDQLPDINRWTKSFDFHSIIEQWNRVLPANWRELESDELDQVVELMSSEGLSLAWAPRVEVVREILAAESHEQRCQVLCRREDQIVEDIDAALELVKRKDLLQPVEEWPKVVGPYRDGWYEAAQSYAATLITEISHGPMEWDDFKPVRDSFQGRDPMEEGIHSFALCAVGTAWVRVVDNFKKAGSGFNRNLTQHRVGFHNQANCLMGMLLLPGLLVELQRYLNAEDRRETEERDEAA